ncbi:hypothetical protein E5Q_02322 [Mixia osmundae IAM 14324]|uniref:Carboxylic ester hydrolase n=2 Tax=Mixia osmundae (strain CBS 9802 / IAM 14324 / JCM 22182 / KY 12970) TaxID=764103 RepID=G7DYK5_MIXOS|nr:hypothetical protein E5Q_02322 [Mixia osmundae IAM 14324]
MKATYWALAALLLTAKASRFDLALRSYANATEDASTVPWESYVDERLADELPINPYVEDETTPNGLLVSFSRVFRGDLGKSALSKSVKKTTKKTKKKKASRKPKKNPKASKKHKTTSHHTSTAKHHTSTHHATSTAARATATHASTSTPTPATDIVKLSQGTYQGSSANGIDSFRGVPYAMPPIGAYRFRAPRAISSRSTKTYSATNGENACPQKDFTSSTTEDCLTINVHRPTGVQAGHNLPVYVFIYGGALITGSPNYASYLPINILNRGLATGRPFIFAAINYRMGAFGFLGVEEMQDADLNAGLLDQRMALQWVQSNIAAFGGNPRHVVIGGQSAGAFSATWHALYSPSSLFAGIIAQSGAPGTFAYSDRETAASVFSQPVIDAAGCSKAPSPLTCLRLVRLEDLLAASNNANSARNNVQWPWQPTLGSRSQLPSQLYASNNIARVPMLLGTCQDESTMYVSTNTNSDSGVKVDIEALVPGNRTYIRMAEPYILQRYPDVPSLGSPYNTGSQLFGMGSQFKRAASIAGDITFESPRRALAIAASKNAAVYAYTYSVGGSDNYQGVSHGCELATTFLKGVDTGNAQEVAFSNRVADRWINFIYSLSPNAPYTATLDGVNWPMYGSNGAMLNISSHQKDTITSDTYRTPGIALLNYIAHAIPR